MSASEIFSPADDERAFTEVYRAHHQKLLRYCQYRLRDRYEAEDVMQEAFVRAWRSMPASSYQQNFYPWLRVVAGNLCTDVLRKRSRSEPAAHLEPGVIDGGMDHIGDQEDRALVRRALERLNDRHREALMLREEEGLTYDQIAERTGVTSATVESLLWRARQALKREFVVLAGRQGCLGVLAVLVGLAARLRAAGRSAQTRLARRLSSVAGSESPGLHVVLTALTAATVVGGVAATLTLSPSPRASAAVVGVRASHRISPPSTVLPPAAAAPVPAGPLPTPAAAAAPVAAEAVPRAVAKAAAAPAGPAPFRLQNPIVAGPGAARNYRQAPTQLSIGPVAVGLSAPEVAGYLSQVSQRIGSLQLPINLQEKK